MKKIDLGQTIAILANVGVIAGIIFLAVETQQTNDLLRLEAMRSQLEMRLVNSSAIVNNSELASILHRKINREPITAEEEFRFTWFVRELFTVMEWQYREFESGGLEFEVLPIGGWEGWFEIPGVPEEWEISGRVRDPGFVELVESEVLGQ